MTHRTNNHLQRASAVAALALLLACPQRGAAQPLASPPQPLWEVGAIGLGVSQQAYPGADQNVNRGLLLPYLVYRGEWLRADRGSVGLRAFKTPTLELDVGFAAALGSRASDSEARRGMADLGTLVEFGPRLQWQLGPGPANGRWRAQFTLRSVHDLDDRFSRKGLSFEPELIYQRRASNGWRYSTSAGLIMGDQRLGQTFYEVSPAEATTLRPAYAASSGLIAWRVGLNVSRQLTPKVRLFGLARLDSVAGAANRDSPLVRQTQGASVGLGLIYTWAKSDTLVSE